MALTLGTIGTPLNIKFRQGSTWGTYPITIKNKETTLPIDLTGKSFIANIKKSYSGQILATISVNIIDAVGGKIGLTIPSTVTSLLKGNPNSEPEYVWDMEMINSDTTIEPIFYGTVTSVSNV